MTAIRIIGGRNLFGTWKEETEPPSEDAMKVFLRVKPNNTDDSIIYILDRRTVLIRRTCRIHEEQAKTDIPDEFKYTFTNVYNQDVTQSEIFSGCVAPLIEDIFASQHCLLFTYGTANTGKIFTVLAFETISGREYNNSRMMPHMFNSVLEVTDSFLKEEISFKQNIINSNCNYDKTRLDRRML